MLLRVVLTSSLLLQRVRLWETKYWVKTQIHLLLWSFNTHQPSNLSSSFWQSHGAHKNAQDATDCAINKPLFMNLSLGWDRNMQELFYILHYCNERNILHIYKDRCDSLLPHMYKSNTCWLFGREDGYSYADGLKSSRGLKCLMVTGHWRTQKVLTRFLTRND